MKAEYDDKGQTIIINLTILECKLQCFWFYIHKFHNNKSNHIGM